MHFTYSISLWNYTHYSTLPPLEQVLASLRAQGYGVELWSDWQGRDLFDPSERARLRHALNGMPVSLHTTAVATTRDLHQRQIDTAAELGARVLVIHPSDIRLPDGNQPNIELAAWVVEYARQRNVRIALENGQLPFITRALEALPELYACLDVGHVYLTPEPMHRFLDVVKTRLIHLHLQDTMTPLDACTPDAPKDHYIPGTGGIPRSDWQLFAKTLQEIDFTGMAVFEIRPRSVLQSAHWGKKFAETLFKETIN